VASSPKGGGLTDPQKSLGNSAMSGSQGFSYELKLFSG
jgi:hypothetical protein